MKIKKVIAVLTILIFAVITMAGCSLIPNINLGEDNDGETIQEQSLNDNQKDKIEYAIKHYFYGMQTADLNYFLMAFPSFMHNNYTQQMLDNTHNNFEQNYGKDIHISYELLTQKEVEPQEIETMQKFIESMYDSQEKITAGYIIRLTATIQGDKSSDTDELEFYVFEINGDWYYLEETPESAEYYL